MRGVWSKAAVLISVALASAAARAATPLAEQRLALLSESDATAAERVERLWRLCQLEERAGNLDLAAVAAEKAVRAAGVAATIDGLVGGGPDAPPAFDEVMRRGLEVGDRLGDPELFLEVIAWRPELAKTHVESARNALLLRSYVVALDLRDPLLATLGADPAWHVYLTSAWNRPETLPDAALEPLGALGAKVLRQRLFAALDAGDLTAARGLAERLARNDRFDPRVRIARHLLDEIAAGAPLTAADVVAIAEATQATRHAGLTMKLDRLVKARPAANGLALALAYQMWTLHLTVEARRVAAHVADDPRATAEQRLTAAELIALAALEAGDEDAFVGWEKRAGAAPSLALAQEVLDRQNGRWSDHRRPPSAAKRLALRAVFAQPFGPTTKDVQLGWAEDAALVFDDEDLRARATRVVALNAPGHARLIASCRRMTLAADECQARLRLLDSLALGDGDDDDDDGPGRVSDPADVIDRVPDLPASGLLALARAPAKKLAALGPRLARLRTERYQGTVGLSELELAVQLARGETAAARDAFARVGASLPRGDRVAFALRLSPLLAKRASKGHVSRDKDAVDDAAAGGDEGEPAPPFNLPRAAEADVVRKKVSPPAEADAATTEAEAEPDTGAEAPVRQVVEVFTGRWRAERTLKKLPPTWRRLDGVAGAETAGWVWIVARDAREAALAREARARVLKLAARGDIATRIETELALERGQSAPALELARRLWTMAPSSSVAEELFLRAWLHGLGGTELTGGARVWVPRLGRVGGPLRVTRAGRAVDLGLAKTAADLLALDEASDDQDKLLAFSPDVVDPAAVMWWIQDQYGKLPAADAPALAKRVRAYLARATPARHDERPAALELWSQFLAGDSRAAAAVLHAPRPRRGTAFRDVPLFAPAEARTVDLGLALGEPLDAAFRQRFFSLMTGHGKAGDLAGDLAKRADAARVKEDAGRFRELACLASAHGRRAAPTLALCRRTWATGARSPFVAEALAEALADDPAAARRDGFDGAAFFREARAALKPVPPALSHDEATWLAELRRTPEAAALEASALADGFDRPLTRVPHVIDWSRTQPLLAEVEVALTHYTDGERGSSLGLVALLGGDPEAGELYFRTSVRSTKDETDLGDAQKETRSRAYIFLDLIEVARADVRRNRLDAQVLADSVESMVQKDIMTQLPSLRRRYPSSQYLALLAADSFPGRPAAADPVLQQLCKDFPTNPMVARISFASLLLSKRLAEASTVLEAARKAHPDDPLLADLTAPTAATANGPTPPWAATAPAFAEALAKADPAPLASAEPRYESWAAGNLDAYVPKDFEHDPTQEFGFLHDGVRLLALRVPRVTHCQPAACLEELAAVLEKQGLKELWTRPVRLPLGEAHEGMFRGPIGLVVVAAIPSGPDVIYVSTGGPADKLRAALPIARLYRESMRADDAALGKARTALLTRNLWVERGAVDLRARLRPLDGAGKTCPLAAEALPTSHAAPSSALLARLYLATPRREDRVRLLACASPERETSAALGLAALWDGPDEAAAFGRAVVTRRAREVALLLNNGVDLTNEHAARDDLLDGRDGLLAGTLQALEALPTGERAKLVERFRASGEPRLRALALASVRWAPDALAAAEQEKILLEGSEEDTLMLLAALPPTLDAPLLAAARKRLDGLAAPLARERLRLAAVLALKLARALDAADGPRLARVRQALRGADDLDDELVPRARRAIGAHAADRLGEKADLETQAVLARWHRAATAETVRATPASLDLPLSSRLPDHGWGFFAIRQPRAFVAALSDTVRGASDAPADRSAPGRLLMGRFLEAVGTERLSTSGLDVDQPLECALGTGAHDTWICTGRLSDEAAWRRRLEEGAPRDAGLMLPEVIGSFATVLPSLGIFIPVMVPEPAAKHGEGGGGGKGSLVAEHVRDRRSIAGLDVWRDTDVRVSGDHVLATKETLSLIVGQRVWLFSDEQTLHLWMAMSPRTESEPGAAAATARRPGALVAFWPSDEDNDVPGGFTFDLDATSEGLHIRSRSVASTAPADTDALAARLPPGAALRFAAANVDALPVMGFRGPTKASLSDSAPPVWLWSAGAGVAFGWYAGDGTKPEQWVTAVRWEPSVQNAWRARHLPEPTERPAVDRAWSFARAGDVLVVSSDRGLLDASLAAKPAATRGGALSAATQGAALTKLLERRAARAAKGTEAAEGLQSWTLIASVLASIETTAHFEDRAVVSETWLRPSTRAGGRDHSSVDALLGSHRLKNSLRLPVDVDDERAERALTLVVRGSQPDEIRRVFPGSDRLSVSDAGPGLERLRILPAPPARKGAPLSENERRLYLGESGPPAPAIRATARDIVAGLTSPWDRARAIVAWVHREMTYEITPSSIDDVTLLDKRHGDCTEYAQLTIALLRALDVPARPRNGLLASGRSLVAHAWVEFHDGQAWHELDPTMGRTSVDAAYVDASIVDLLPLLTDARLSVTSVE